jgi:hypothetical protein
MNRKPLWIFLLAVGMTYVTGCGGSNKNNILVSISQAPPGIITPGGTAQITATVTGDSAHAGVTWSCTPGNSAATCGSFNPGTTPSGTSTMYLAPPPPTAVGPVVITATSVTNIAAFATANVNISTSGGLAGNYAFYVSGLDFNSVYSLAGAVTIAADGALTGEQDYNDGSGITSPESGGDMITGGSLSFDPTSGLGTLTLITNNKNVGTNGTETLALNFVNNNHALIIQADGSATSSGSFDLQTLPSTPAGGFSFALSGADSGGNTAFFGGVFNVSGTSVTNGIFDENSAAHSHPSLNNSFTGTLSAADAFGRGTFTQTGIANTIVYYIVGPEALRLIDVDSNSTSVGSAFGQGSSAGIFTNAAIGNSVFSVQSNFAGNLYAAVGQIVPSAGSFNGVADVNEELVGFADAQQITNGTFSVGTNGYGSLTIPSGQLGDVSALGIYATDPALNLNDPNNTASPGAGNTFASALVVDLDANVIGSGVLVPQTDNATASFAGNYALGFQDFVDDGISVSGELDFVGNATATATAPALLTGNGVMSDPFDLLGGASFSETGSFTSPITPDPNPANLGRYEISPFSVTVETVTTPIPYLAVVYQASGGQLFWIEDGADGQASVFGGQLQQQVLPLGADAKKAAAAKSAKH